MQQTTHPKKTSHHQQSIVDYQTIRRGQRADEARKRNANVKLLQNIIARRQVIRIVKQKNIICN